MQSNVAFILYILQLCYETSAQSTSTNTTLNQADYRVRWTNRCAGSWPVVPHFTVSSGTVCTLGNESLSAITKGGSQDFNVVLNKTMESPTSSWRTWVDTSYDVTETTNSSTLVELTREDSANKSTYYVDISIIDALTYPVEIIPPSGGCTQILNGAQSGCGNIDCSPPQNWSCPSQNRFDYENQGMYLSHSYLSADQSCISNCTLLETDEACCSGAFASADVCQNANPALKSACPQAYSYAFDDATSLMVWETYSVSGDAIDVIEIIACP